MEDCLDALRNYEELSKEEHTACKRMFKYIVEFLVDEGVIEDDSEELKERLQDFFDSISVEE
jgi:hypothetical protein